jgi:hypothetical protein
MRQITNIKFRNSPSINANVILENTGLDECVPLMASLSNTLFSQCVKAVPDQLRFDYYKLRMRGAAKVPSPP